MDKIPRPLNPQNLPSYSPVRVFHVEHFSLGFRSIISESNCILSKGLCIKQQNS